MPIRIEVYRFKTGTPASEIDEIVNEIASSPLDKAERPTPSCEEHLGMVFNNAPPYYRIRDANLRIYFDPDNGVVKLQRKNADNPTTEIDHSLIAGEIAIAPTYTPPMITVVQLEDPNLAPTTDNLAAPSKNIIILQDPLGRPSDPFFYRIRRIRNSLRHFFKF